MVIFTVRYPWEKKDDLTLTRFASIRELETEHGEDWIFERYRGIMVAGQCVVRVGILREGNAPMSDSLAPYHIISRLTTGQVLEEDLFQACFYCLNNDVLFLCTNSENILTQGPGGTLDDNGLKGSWLDHACRSAVYTANGHDKNNVKPWIERIGVSIHSQAVDQWDVWVNDPARKKLDQFPNYFDTSHPYAMVLWHTGRNFYAMSERILGARALVEPTRNKIQCQKRCQKHLHLNNPDFGVLTHIKPYQDFVPYPGSGPRNDNPAFVQCIKELWNDPFFLSSVDTVRNGWTVFDIENNTPHDMRQYAEHGNAPLDIHMVPNFSVMANGSHQDYFKGNPDAPHENVWNIPLAFWFTPFQFFHWRQRGTESKRKRESKDAQHRAKAKDAASTASTTVPSTRGSWGVHTSTSSYGGSSSSTAAVHTAPRTAPQQNWSQGSWSESSWSQTSWNQSSSSGSRQRQRTPGYNNPTGRNDRTLSPPRARAVQLIYRNRHRSPSRSRPWQNQQWQVRRDDNDNS